MMSKLNTLEKLAVAFTLAASVLAGNESQADTIVPVNSQCVVTEQLKTSGLGTDTVRQYDFSNDMLIYRTQGSSIGGVSATPFSQLSARVLKNIEAIRPAGC
jgi:hypothetical protein